MKRIILLIAMILPIGASVAAKEAVNRIVEVRNISIVQSKDVVELLFTAEPGKKATRTNYMLKITPVLSNGDNSAAFKPLIIEGTNSEISRERSSKYKTNGCVITKNDREVNYSAALPYEDWMAGSKLTMDGFSEGCCSALRMDLGMVADSLMLPAPVIVTRTETVQIANLKTTGDELSEIYPFIVPYSKATPLDVDDRQGAVTVYFPQNVKEIRRDYMNNNQSMIDIVSAIRRMESSTDSEIVSVVLVGFASPEGKTEVNERLASERAETFRDFLLDNSTLRPEVFDIYNGSVDWGGLKKSVSQSAMSLADKQAVINIIETVPVWDAATNRGRLGELMRLRGGEPYRYMYDNIFPEMRNSTCIKVYYENK